MTTVRKANPFQGYGASLVGGRYLDMGAEITTAPTTGLQVGYMFVGFDGTMPTIGVVFSSAQGIKYVALSSKTWGRATP
jgi:hypothetical protein